MQGEDRQKERERERGGGRMKNEERRSRVLIRHCFKKKKNTHSMYDLSVVIETINDQYNCFL